jgi:hypothetical protein
LSNDPDLARAVAHGAALLRDGRVAEARAHCDLLLRRHPGGGDALWHLAADVALACEDVFGALGYVERMLERAPQDARLHVRKAQLLLAARARRDAIDSAAHVAVLEGAGAPELRAAASVLTRCNSTAAARACLERAYQLSPRAPGVLYDLALAQFYADNTADTERCLAAVLDQLPQHGGTLYLRSLLRVQTAERNNIAELQQTLAAGRGTPADVAATNFALAKECEDLGEYRRAFAALRTGAQLKRRLVNYSSQHETGAMRGIEAAFGPAEAAAATPGCDEAGPIFVVGMPRTGTTLVERILSNHSVVESIGEFPEFPVLLREQADLTSAAVHGQQLTPAQASVRIDFAALGRRYLEAARQLCNARRFVDKLPHNAMYCGHILKALPSARVIHLVRDPMDTCYAVFKTLFNQAYYYSYDLDELADYYIAYRRLMDHWHRVMPGAILDVSYEDIVADPERQAQRILAWCDLGWEPEVLEFYRSARDSTTASAAQVRRPVYASSVGRWQNYANELAGLRARLDAAGVLTTQRTATT